MGSMEPEKGAHVYGEITQTGKVRRKPRFFCLHGFHTSGTIMKKQVISKWPSHITDRMDLFFADAPFPVEVASDMVGTFPLPYFDWFQFNEEFTEYPNFEKCLAYIEDLMIKHGPFDGLMGFSQGAILSAALPGQQLRGLALTKVPKIKCTMIISGAMFLKPEVAEKAYCPMIECPSLHFLSKEDFLSVEGEKLLKFFVEPFVIRHLKGHTVPRLDEESLETMNAFLNKIESDLASTSYSAKDKSPVSLSCQYTSKL